MSDGAAGTNPQDWYLRVRTNMDFDPSSGRVVSETKSEDGTVERVIRPEPPDDDGRGTREPLVVSEPRPFAFWKVCYFGLMAVLAALIVFVLIGSVLGWFNPIP